MAYRLRASVLLVFYDFPSAGCRSDHVALDFMRRELGSRPTEMGIGCIHQKGFGLGADRFIEINNLDPFRRGGIEDFHPQWVEGPIG